MASQAQPIHSEFHYKELELAELRAEHERELENARIRAENPIFDLCFKILTKKPRKTKSRSTSKGYQLAAPSDEYIYFYPDRAANSLDGGLFPRRRPSGRMPLLRTLADILSGNEELRKPANLEAPLALEDLSTQIREVEATKARTGFSPLHHFELLHSHQTREKQWVAICKKEVPTQESARRRPWSQWMYQFDHFLVRDQMISLAGANDAYMSANQFYRPKRYAERVSGITSIYFDLDNVEKNIGISKELAAAKILKMCDDRGIPRPTVIMDSGNGLHVYYVFDEVQKSSKSGKWKLIWTKIADMIDETFKDTCPRVVDRAVSDLARVLRVAGSVNSKNGQIVKPLFVSGEYLSPKRISFVALGDAVLELTDAEWQAQFEARRQAKLAKQADTSSQRSNLGKVVQLKDHRKAQAAAISRSGKAAFDSGSYARVVLEDLKKLSDAGYVTEGRYDHWLLLYAVQMSFLVRSAEELRARIHEAARTHNWDLSRAMAVMGTVIARAEAAYQGKKEEYNGRLKDPRYSYSKKRMVELLGLKTETIMGLNLRALTNSEVKQRQDRLRKAIYRRQIKTAQTQAEVAAERDARSRMILEQVYSGTSVTVIARANKVTRQTVYNVLRRHEASYGSVSPTLRENQLAA